MKRKIFRLIYIINIILIVSILAYLIYLALNKYNKKDSTEYIYEQFKGYQLKLASDLKYKNNDDEIILESSKENWSAIINIMNDPNNVVFNNIGRLEEILKFKGFDVSDLHVHTVDGIQYITMKRKMAENSMIPYMILGYYKPNNSQICEIMINDSIDGNNLNYHAFEEVVKMLKSAKYDQTKDEKYHYTSLTFKGTLQALYGEEETE